MRGCIIGAVVLVTFSACTDNNDDAFSDEEQASTSEAFMSSSRSCGFEAAARSFPEQQDRTNPFFADLGVNGRTCESCHDERAGWTQSRSLAKRLFRDTDGNHPLFRPHDGANNPNADVSTEAARRIAYSMMLDHNTTRFSRSVPAAGFAELTVEAVSDPYGFSTTTTWSSFRKANPVSAELKEVTITWTGTPADPLARLQLLMNAAARGHALRTTDVPPEEQLAGANFMAGLSFAQAVDEKAGPLDEDGARGGPVHFAQAPFYVGQNALGGDTVTGAPFNPEVFTIFEAWRDADKRSWHHHNRCKKERDRARAQIARGEDLFNKRKFDIRGVNGLNDALGQTVVRGTCSTCHNTPNIGGHSEFRLMDTGVVVKSVQNGDYPVITIRNKTTGETKQVTDLGRGGSTGLWADIGKFKAPPLRGLRSRAPYFHNGSAQSIEDVVKFYKERFHIRLDRDDEEDLVAFLRAL